MRLARRSLLLLAVISCLVPSVRAADAVPFSLSGPTFTGQMFDVARQRGRVVMVFYWASDCAYCRAKLPELRANHAGWKDKPFDLVTVSVDQSEADWRRYEELKAATQSEAAKRSVAMWAGAKGFQHGLGARPKKLPMVLVLDAEGFERHRVEGQVKDELWDNVAELLP